MKSSKFFRRYRELEKYRPQKTYETHYTQDTAEVFQALSGNQSNEHAPIVPPISPPKYHGKLVRTQEYQQAALLNREKRDLEKRRHYQRAAQQQRLERERKHATQLAQELMPYVMDHKPIPRKLIEESKALKGMNNGQRSHSVTENAHTSSPNSISPHTTPPRHTSAPDPPVVFQKPYYSIPITHTQVMVMDKTRSHNKYSKEEVSRLRELILTYPPPPPPYPPSTNSNSSHDLTHHTPNPTHHPSHHPHHPTHQNTHTSPRESRLSLYAQHIADMFVCVCPHREKAEVSRRVETMVRKKIVLLG